MFHVHANMSGGLSSVPRARQVLTFVLGVTRQGASDTTKPGSGFVLAIMPLSDDFLSCPYFTVNCHGIFLEYRAITAASAHLLVLHNTARHQNTDAGTVSARNTIPQFSKSVRTASPVEDDVVPLPSFHPS